MLRFLNGQPLPVQRAFLDPTMDVTRAKRSAVLEEDEAVNCTWSIQVYVCLSSIVYHGDFLSIFLCIYLSFIVQWEYQEIKIFFPSPLPLKEKRNMNSLRAYAPYAPTLVTPLLNNQINIYDNISLNKSTYFFLSIFLSIQTDPNLYLLVTFHNLSAPVTVKCEGAFIEVQFFI